MHAHIEFQHRLNAELLDSGELVDAQGLAGPEVAKFVVSDGVKPPKIIDGPYPESKELLAGYRMIDVASLDRALEIAARSSAAPGPNRSARRVIQGATAHCVLRNYPFSRAVPSRCHGCAASCAQTAISLG